MTIQEIITNAQKNRHENHVRAGKSIKEKWKQEARKELIEEFKKNLNKVYNTNPKDVQDFKFRLDKKLEEINKNGKK